MSKERDVAVGQAIAVVALFVIDTLNVVVEYVIAAVVMTAAVLIAIPVAGVLLVADGVAWIWRGVRGCLS